MPVRILLLGGIGSGKSTAARWFAGQGVATISSDEVAASVLAPGTDATASVLSIWPSAGTDGVIDRSALGRIVFADPAELAALEAIVHPATRRSVQLRVAASPDAHILVEMALIRPWFDGDWEQVVVDASDEIRIERTLEREPVMTREDVLQVMRRQPTRAEWLLTADFVIDNGGAEQHLVSQCSRVWARLRGT